MKLPTCFLATIIGFAALTASFAQTILVDFGPAGYPTVSPDVNGNYWNNIFGTSVGSSIGNLTTTENLASGITMTITTAFAANGPSETPPALTGQASLGDLNIGTALSDFFYVSNSSAVITFSNLDPTKTYDFAILGSRDFAGTRTTDYTLAGANTGSQNLQTSGVNLGGSGINYNNSSLAYINSITPNGSNSITLTVHSTGLGYLNALQLTAVPEPATAILSVSGIGLLFLSKRARQTRRTCR